MHIIHHMCSDLGMKIVEYDWFWDRYLWSVLVFIIRSYYNVCIMCVMKVFVLFGLRRDMKASSVVEWHLELVLFRHIVYYHTHTHTKTLHIHVK